MIFKREGQHSSKMLVGVETPQKTFQAQQKIRPIVQCTEGGDCDLGFQGLKFFFGNNGLGGFLGPHWKVFHPGTLSGHFQGVVIAFGSRPGGEKRVKMG